MGLLGEACQAITGHRPWLRPDQLARLRRGERRYAHYAAYRPERAPTTPAATMVALVEHAPHGVRAPLPWAIAQLDLLSKRMRRTARRATETQRLPAARKRARRRLEAHQSEYARRLPFRTSRQGGLLDATIDQLAAELADTRLRAPDSVAPSFGGGDLAAHLELLVAHLADRRVCATVEQLRLRLRDQLLLTDAPVNLVAWAQGGPRSQPSAVFEPAWGERG